MQHLQWFPGHMTAAMRMMEDSVKLVDGVLIVVDARAPFSCENKKLDKLFENKKVLYIVNKSDLIDKKDQDKIVSSFKKSGKEAICVSAMDKRAVDLLYNKIFSLLSEKVEKNKLKGIFKPLRVMVAGIPNTGKSTIINGIVGGKKTLTGNKAGVTKGKQWVRIRELELLDTPGTMPPYFENQYEARHLAYIGSMNDSNLDFGDLAYSFLDELKATYPAFLTEKYGIDDMNMDIIDMFNAICLRRGFLLKGNDYDYDRCAKAIIDDFRKGRIGKILLDKVD